MIQLKCVLAEHTLTLQSYCIESGYTSAYKKDLYGACYFLLVCQTQYYNSAFAILSFYKNRNQRNISITHIFKKVCFEKNQPYAALSAAPTLQHHGYKMDQMCY